MDFFFQYLFVCCRYLSVAGQQGKPQHYKASLPSARTCTYGYGKIRRMSVSSIVSMGKLSLQLSLVHSSTIVVFSLMSIPPCIYSQLGGVIPDSCHHRAGEQMSIHFVFWRYILMVMFLHLIVLHGWYLTHSTPDLSSRHHLHLFSQKLRYGWENIWRRVVHFTKLNNVCSNLFQNSRRHWQKSKMVLLVLLGLNELRC
jgi:hypothetical protein